jgi:hypothetical protein
MLENVFKIIFKMLVKHPKINNFNLMHTIPTSLQQLDIIIYP